MFATRQLGHWRSVSKAYYPARGPLGISLNARDWGSRVSKAYYPARGPLLKYKAREKRLARVSKAYYPARGPLFDVIGYSGNVI